MKYLFQADTLESHEVLEVFPISLESNNITCAECQDTQDRRNSIGPVMFYMTSIHTFLRDGQFRQPVVKLILQEV